MRCVACHAEIARPGRFCPECAAPLVADGNATETIAMRQKPPSSTSASSEDGRFPAGTLLSERYRLISIVGRGGMGEVYRASDLKLNQPVALKFLPPGGRGEAGTAGTLPRRSPHRSPGLASQRLPRVRHRRGRRLGVHLDGVRGWRRPGQPAAPHRAPAPRQGRRDRAQAVRGTRGGARQRACSIATSSPPTS